MLKMFLRIGGRGSKQLMYESWTSKYWRHKTETKKLFLVVLGTPSCGRVVTPDDDLWTGSGALVGDTLGVDNVKQ